MRTIFALVAVFFSSVASATCYQVFSPANILLWQGTQPPVAINVLSADKAIEKRFPGGHLVIVDDPTIRCFAFDLAERDSGGPMVKPLPPE